jgi:ABC-type branched-subunit amino acid transport system ATPase component
MISLQGITKSFGGLPVIKDLSFDFKPNKKYGIVGPNNCGKSTLLYLIAGFYKHDLGNILWINGEEKNINNYSVVDRSQLGIGITFQDPRSFNDFTVEQNLMLSLFDIKSDNIIFSGKQKIDIAEYEDELVKLFFFGNLIKYRKENVSSLSYGNRKVLDTLCLFARNSKFILLDEPFAGVDPSEVDTIYKLITEAFKEERTIIIVSHEVSLISDLVDEIILMDDHANIILNDCPQRVINSEFFKEVYSV